MSCTCINDIDISLMSKFNDEKASMNTSYDFTGNIVYPTIRYTFRKKNKKGEFIKKSFEGILVPKYCPFCGKEYKK